MTQSRYVGEHDYFIGEYMVRKIFINLLGQCLGFNTRDPKQNAKSHALPIRGPLSFWVRFRLCILICALGSIIAYLSHVLRWDSLATTPEAYAAHGGESEENAEIY